MKVQFGFILFTPRFVSARTLIRETAHLAHLAQVFPRMTFVFTRQNRLSICAADPVSFCFVRHEPMRREIEKDFGRFAAPAPGVKIVPKKNRTKKFD